MSSKPDRQVNLPSSGVARFLTAAGRALRRKCPYCGGGGIFKDYFTLHDRCPHCTTLFAYEDGYFLGSYAVNVVAILVIGIALVFGLIVYTELSVLQMQVAGVLIIAGLPVLLYPLSLLIWIAIDLGIHDPGDFSHRTHR